MTGACVIYLSGPPRLGAGLCSKLTNVSMNPMIGGYGRIYVPGIPSSHMWIDPSHATFCRKFQTVG